MHARGYERLGCDRNGVTIINRYPFILQFGSDTPQLAVGVVAFRFIFIISDVIHGEKMKDREKTELKEILKLSPKIGPIIRDAKDENWDITFDMEYGKGMIMLSEGGLKKFEWEAELRTYDFPNHVLVEFLAPLNFNNPIIFWVSRGNPKGINYIFEKKPILHHIIQIGPEYDFSQILVSLSQVFKIDRPTKLHGWIKHVDRFKKFVKDKTRQDIYDIAPDLRGIL